MTAFGVVALALAISAKPGTTLVTVVLAVVFMIVTLFGCALFPSRTVGALVSGGIGLAALVSACSRTGLGTTRSPPHRVGMLLVFFGFARVATPLIPALSSLTSPVARWSVFALNILVWPFFAFPYWSLRYAFWGPGAAWKRVLAFVAGAWNPLVLAIVVVMAVRKLTTSWTPEWPADFPGVIPDGSTTRSGVRTRAGTRSGRHRRLRR